MKFKSGVDDSRKHIPLKSILHKNLNISLLKFKGESDIFKFSLKTPKNKCRDVCMIQFD